VTPYSIHLFGISAPWFSWVAAVGLIVWPAYEILKLITLSRKQQKICAKLLVDINELQKQYPFHGSQGLAAVAIDKLHKLFLDIPSFAVSWNTFRSKLIYRQKSSDSDEEQVWSTGLAVTIFSDDVFLGNDFNKRHFHAIPGIVTGIGLLMTFVAILVGLLDVRIGANKQVQGLEGLIGGLSGKFISSVAALLSATIFLMSEKRVFHRLDRIRTSIATALDSLVPCRTEPQLLEEICLNNAEQTTAFRTFNADLALKLRNSFSESIGPTLDRMVTAVDTLNQVTRATQSELLDAIREMNELLKRSESSRQESITGQIEQLLRQLQASLASSIENMSREFNRALTGTTQDQFGRVAETVGATAHVLEGMNKQFTDTQEALQELITLAKQSTEKQLTNGTAMIEKMVAVLGGSVIQMEQRLADISDKMASTIEGTSERSRAAASEVISEVKNLNEQNAHKFLEMLQKHEEQLDKVELLKQTLQDAVEGFGEYVTGYNHINADLKNVSKEVSAAMATLSHSAQKLKEGQESFNKVAEFARVQVQTLGAAQENQKEIWNGINNTMEKYRQTFQSVETSATNVLSQISSHLQSFSRATQDHFNKTISVANNHVDEAVGKLGTSIEELSEKLDDLGEIVSDIDKIYSKAKG
jgi:methyl-accepting chemotaxis protein